MILNNKCSNCGAVCYVDRVDGWKICPIGLFGCDRKTLAEVRSEEDSEDAVIPDERIRMLAAR